MIAKPVATAGHLRQHERERAGADRRDSSGHRRFSSVRPGLTSGQRGLHTGARQQVGDRRRGLRAPAQPDPDPGGDQPPAGGDRHDRGRPPVRPASVTAASAVAAAALSSTVVLQEVGEPHRQFATSSSSNSRTPSVPSTTTSASAVIAAGPSSELTPTRTARDSVPPRPARRASGTRLGRSRHRQRTARRRRPYRAGTTRSPAPLSISHGRPDLEHLAPPVRAQPGGLGVARRSRRPPPGRPPRPGRRASERRRSDPCPRASRAGRRSSAVSAARANSRIRRPTSATSGRVPASVHPARSSSAPWEPRYAIVPIATIARGLRRPPAGDARDHRVALGDLDQQLRGSARARARRRRARRSAQVSRPCRTGSPHGPGRREAARAPRSGALTSRHLVCPSWSSHARSSWL